MNNSAKKLLALALAAAMTLSACGNKGGSTGTNETNQNSSSTTQTESSGKHEISDLVLGDLTELTTFNMLYSQSNPNGEVLCNVWDSLLEVDTNGKLLPCLAEDWGTEDGGLTWTFHIREGLKWVDYQGNEKADCNAYDWATGMEWVLNYYKNEGHNTSMPSQMLQGAAEYYEYTKNLSEEEARSLTAEEGSVFMDMVGIEIPEEHTLIYHCVSEKPYFETLAIYGCLYPLAQGLVDELGVDGLQAMDNTTMWYNGAYLMDEYVADNSKHLVKNPTYWDTESYRFDTVTIYMLESSDVAYTLFQNGELDYIDLTESSIKTISSNPDHEFYDNMLELPATKYSYQFYFNYDKVNEDGTPDVNWNTAAANEAFRKAFYYGFNSTEYLHRINSINPLKCENDYYCVSGLAFTSDGTDYMDLVKEKLQIPENNGETISRYNAELFEQYKAQAMEELTALGVTFPVEIDYYAQASNQTDLDSATVMKNNLESCLGTDFITVNIQTYVSSYAQEVRNVRLHSMVVNAWGADYGDPVNFLGQMTLDNDNAWYSVYYTYINNVEESDATAELLADYRTYTDMVNAADAMTDLTQRYEAFAEAEAFLIENTLCLPISTKTSWCLSKINPYTKMNASYGGVNEKMKNWETSAEPYTAEEINDYLSSK